MAPKVLVKEQRGVIGKDLVFPEGFTDGDVGGGRLYVRYHHFRNNGIVRGKQFTPPVAFETDFITDIIQIRPAAVVGIIDLISYFYRLEAQAERFAAQDGPRGFVTVACVKEEFGTGKRQTFLVDIEFP